MTRNKRQERAADAAGAEKQPPAAAKLLLRRRIIMGLLSFLLLVGVILLLYPTVSGLWNAYHQTKAVVSYVEQTEAMDEETRKALWEDAKAYNEALAKKETQSWTLTDEEREVYEKQLSVDIKGTMGYIEIPCINTLLPIYHGISEAVLQEGVGHIEGSSLPVGGVGSHTVVSGHRGLPSARLFTELDRVKLDDVFYLHVLGETMAYKVDQILTVEPHEMEELKIQLGKDYCTLVTCTPYGINSHRLLVRGHRIDLAEAEAAVPTEEPRVNYAVFILASIGAQLVLLAVVVRMLRKNRRRKNT